jgi:hypothetical protein
MAMRLNLDVLDFRELREMRRDALSVTAFGDIDIIREIALPRWEEPPDVEDALHRAKLLEDFGTSLVGRGRFEAEKDHSPGRQRHSEDAGSGGHEVKRSGGFWMRVS